MKTWRETAKEKAGYRERYAMDHGNESKAIINGNVCYRFTYSRLKEYQDANSATYDTIRKTWID